MQGIIYSHLERWSLAWTSVSLVSLVLSWLTLLASLVKLCVVSPLFRTEYRFPGQWLFFVSPKSCHLQFLCSILVSLECWFHQRLWSAALVSLLASGPLASGPLAPATASWAVRALPLGLTSLGPVSEVCSPSLTTGCVLWWHLIQNLKLFAWYVYKSITLLPGKWALHSMALKWWMIFPKHTGTSMFQ